jgi:hypothetical protein
MNKETLIEVWKRIEAVRNERNAELRNSDEVFFDVLAEVRAMIDEAQDENSH